MKARRYIALTRFQKVLLYLHIALVKMHMGMLGQFLKYIMKLEKGLKECSKKRRIRKTCLKSVKVIQEGVKKMT